MSSIPVFLQGGKIFLDSRMSGNVFVKAGFAGKNRSIGGFRDGNIRCRKVEIGKNKCIYACAEMLRQRQNTASGKDDVTLLSL